ncbi:DUF1631 family protein [Ideonella margarita]|uniref:DUF1631 family protein n=1 Tax=Ideonella margarita TaxID=2984191 RepID=A0ABU9C2L9_9BURK
MPENAPSDGLIGQARMFFAEHLVRDVQAWLDQAMQAAQDVADKPAERAVAQQRRDMLQELMQRGADWPVQLTEQIRDRMSLASSLNTSTGALLSSLQGDRALELVDDATVQREILKSRLSLAIMDRCTWEYADLRARAIQITGKPELDDDDLLRPLSLARCVIRSWTDAGLSLDAWQVVHDVMQPAVAKRCEEAYHETNRWLVERGVMPEVDLRQFIRRADGSPTQVAGLDSTRGAEATIQASGDDVAATHANAGSAPVSVSAALKSVLPDLVAPAAQAAAQQRALSMRPAFGGGANNGGGNNGGGAVQGGGNASGQAAGGPGWQGTQTAGAGFSGAQHASEPQGAHVANGDTGGQAYSSGGPMSGHVHTGMSFDETRMMTRQAPSLGQPHIVLERFSDIMERHVPGFRDVANARPASAQLAHAMAQAQERLVAKAEAGVVVNSSGSVLDGGVSPSALMRELRERQAALKQAASTPAERATIELVALLFQSILTEDRIPAALRVWFARLQMPVLRVAIAEPDFFSSTDHPARRLIDRMGACVMGFEGGAESIGPALETEIKRVVQVVEAFPDTGRRVFQTVLNEFERFLEGYYRDQHEGAKVGVSLAQQIEQRETLAIQYTIEMRKLLSEMPVQEGVRDFLFHIWADVLATTAVRHGPNSDAVRVVREAAAELMWTASAKSSREERAEVIRRLPPLLATLRQGMNTASMAAGKQEEAMKSLNFALTAAFGARATVISPSQLEDLKKRLETIEEMLPDDDFEIDETWVLDDSHPNSENLEIVADGGSMPTPAMLTAATELSIGTAFRLEYRGRSEVVRLAWQGMHKQLSLFAAPRGRCVLFQKARLAAYLQAGLLVPAQDESLTLAATRQAINRINAEPALLN